MFSEIDEVVEGIFNTLSKPIIGYLHSNKQRIRLLVIERLGEETAQVINNVTDSLTDLIANKMQSRN